MLVLFFLTCYLRLSILPVTARSTVSGMEYLYCTDILGDMFTVYVFYNHLRETVCEKLINATLVLHLRDSNRQDVFSILNCLSSDKIEEIPKKSVAIRAISLKGNSQRLWPSNSRICIRRNPMCILQCGTLPNLLYRFLLTNSHLGKRFESRTG